MDSLIEFARKDLIEQITLLEELRERRPPEAVAGLLELYAEPLADRAVDEMVYHTLFELLEGEDQLIASAMKYPSPRIQILAARRAGESVTRLALPSLYYLLENHSSAEVLSEAIRALGCFREPEIIGRVLPFLEHEDYAVTGWAMRVLAGSGDPLVSDAFKQLIDSDPDLARGECDLRPVMAVRHLASFRDEETIDFLIRCIHHPSPAFRKEVVGALAAMGDDALPALERCLESGSRDEKIMAAMAIGIGGRRRGADILVARLQNGSALDSNLKYSIYEALGGIRSMRSMVGLSDGLEEEEEMVMLAVLTGIDQQCNQGIIQKFFQILDRGGAQRDRLLKGIITSRAVSLFVWIHQSPHRARMMDLLLAGGDGEAKALFLDRLATMEGEQAASDFQQLVVSDGTAASRRILAVDDSRAMLAFYKGVAAEMGVEVITAGNGRKALEYLRSNSVDMLIVDMNMPVMDGVELAREARKLVRASLPILMATTESERSQIELAVAAGINDFVSKPFTGKQLRGRIEAILSSGRTEIPGVDR